MEPVPPPNHQGTPLLRIVTLLVFAFLIVAISVLGTFYFLNKNEEESPTTRPENENNKNEDNKEVSSFLTVNQSDKDGKRLSNGRCQGTEKRKLTTLPMRLEDFAFILPYGIMVGDHVTPIDHQYFSPTVFHSPKDTYEVRAMADATLVGIEGPPRSSYRLIFSMSCTLFYYYDLLTSLAPDIRAEYDRLPGSFSKPVTIPVKEGQLIGKIGGQTLDFAVWDMDVVLPGFIVPEHYEGEPWKIHTADPLEYYTDSLKEQIISKYIRTAAPISGKIDYDIDGKAVGNWFKERTGGYVKAGEQKNSYKNHVSLTYNALDPNSVIFSIGQYPGSVSWTVGNERGSSVPLQFGVKGNVPDPKDISIQTGLVKYELVKQDVIDRSTGNLWTGMTWVNSVEAKNDEQVAGVALIQMIADRKLKVEVFPGKTASQVNGFTDKAMLYER